MPWFLNVKESNDQKVLDEEDFTQFVKVEVDDLSLNEDFLAVARIFFDRAMKRVEPSMAIPTTSDGGC